MDLEIQMNGVYANLRSDFRRAIRRSECTDYNSLVVLAAEHEGVILTLGDDIAPPPRNVHYPGIC